MFVPSREQVFHLHIWCEVIGKVYEIYTDEDNIYFKMEKRSVSFPKDYCQAIDLQKRQISTLKGRTIGILRTDIQGKRILIRQIASTNTANKVGS